MPGYSKGASAYISHKIKKLRDEGKSQNAAVGQAMGMAHDKGMKVPAKKKMGRASDYVRR